MVTELQKPMHDIMVATSMSRYDCEATCSLANDSWLNC